MSGLWGTEILRAIGYRDDLALAIHEHAPERYPFLLESPAKGTRQGRFDILFAFPGETLTLDHEGVLQGQICDGAHDFLTALNGWWQHEHVELSPSESPFRGGWFVFLAYELADQIEPTLGLDGGGPLPVALAVRIRSGIVFDHATRAAWAFAEPDHEHLLATMVDDAQAARCDRPSNTGVEPLLSGNLIEEPRDLYLDAIDRAKCYIRDGDIFQANLSRHWEGRLAEGVDPVDVYRRLRSSNPGPFAGMMRWAGRCVLSSSPERLLRIRDGVAETRPIAGTRPRGSDDASDRILSTELIRHPKERAEHVMLIDLERNDLGRVCMPGSVDVDELMVVESYAHVHHIVSNIRGRLRSEVLPGDALRAVFPGGTITGCPKVRCMEIIDELEPLPRSAYTGSFGYINRDGSMDTNILIRTLQLDGRNLSFRAGGGIVADSDPLAELEETRAKARGLRLALEGWPE